MTTDIDQDELLRRDDLTHWDEEDHRTGSRVPWAALATGALIGASAAAYLGARRRAEAADHEFDDDASPRTAKRPDRDDLSLTGASVTISKPRAELYSYWRDFTRLATFMDNVKSVREEGTDTQVWTIQAPLGRSVEVRTRITEDEPDRRIAWASTEASDIRTEGAIDFQDAPGGRGTVVTATVAYDPPSGEVGRLIAKLFRREPGMQGRHELKRFKMLMETGEIATNSNQKSAA